MELNALKYNWQQLSYTHKSTMTKKYYVTVLKVKGHECSR